MSFIDRLLQSRRIVTKVLLFVIPLVLLIAGVGLAGWESSCGCFPVAEFPSRPWQVSEGAVM